MNGNAPDTDNPDWLCLTPMFADGRPLTFEERLRHAATIIARQNLKALDEAQAQIERIAELSPAQRLSALRYVADMLTDHSTRLIAQIAGQLVSDDRWMMADWP